MSDPPHSIVDELEWAKLCAGPSAVVDKSWYEWQQRNADALQLNVPSKKLDWKKSGNRAVLKEIGIQAGVSFCAPPPLESQPMTPQKQTLVAINATSHKELQAAFDSGALVTTDLGSSTVEMPLDETSQAVDLMLARSELDDATKQLDKCAAANLVLSDEVTEKTEELSAARLELTELSTVQQINKELAAKNAALAAQLARAQQHIASVTAKCEAATNQAGQLEREKLVLDKWSRFLQKHGGMAKVSVPVPLIFSKDYVTTSKAAMRMGALPPTSPEARWTVPPGKHVRPFAKWLLL